MAMDGNQLGTEIYDALVNAGYMADDPGNAEAIWQEIGTAIVQHIKTNDAHTHVDGDGSTTSEPTY